MGSKAFLLIVLAIFLVINSEVAARKLAQSSITSLEKEQTNEENNNAKFLGVALPPIGGVLSEIGAPIGFERLSGSGELIEIGAPIESEGLLGSGELIEIGAPIESEGLLGSGELIEIGAPIKSGGLP
ncbi:hypothetical protein AABB24_016572 [Solanum stoloniferum]|uniref:Uncharacterized protein n=1 Tax=Solanum stoloniferum TaxID=62892 RepID=A0ABD2TV59_9SOLN